MNIVLVTEHWPPETGGIEHYLSNIACRLADEVTRVRVIAPVEKEMKKLRNKEINSTNRNIPITNYQLLITRKRFFWPFLKPAWLPLYLYIKKLHNRDRIDVILCGKGLFEGLLGYYCKKRLGILYFVFTYAMEIEEWRKRASTRKKLIKVIHGASRISYINDETKQSLIDLGAGERQLAKILPGVNAEIASSSASWRTPRNDDKDKSILAKFNIQKPYILSVGRLIPRKGFDDLIGAFSDMDQVKYSEWSLVIVGDGPQKGELEKLAITYFLNNEEGDGSVRLLGYVPDEELDVLYNNAEMFVLTPKHIDGDFEGFGIVYLEASMHGLPVIASSCGGAKEAVHHKETGMVVNENSPAEVKEAIEYLIIHKAEAKRMGEAGKRRVQKEFLWENRIKDVKKILDVIH